MTDREYEMQVDRQMQEEYTQSQNLKREQEKMQTVTDECLKKKHIDMTKEELIYTRKYEANGLKEIENLLMRPDATDEALEMATPLMNRYKKAIKEIDELLKNM